MLKENEIYLGDCLEVMKSISDKSVDMILCDLPYGTTACKWDAIIPFEPLWEQYKRIIKENGAIVLFGSQPFTSKLIVSNLNYFKYCWVWDKKRHSNPLISRRQPLNNYEDIAVFYKKQCCYNPQPYKLHTETNFHKEIGKKHNTETKGKAKIIRTGKLNGKENLGFPRRIIKDIPVMNNLSKDKFGLHPTQKPIALLEYLIKTYTQENELVLDNCMGSGSTCVAAINTNRKYIGIEKEEKYFETAKNRIENI